MQGMKLAHFRNKKWGYLKDEINDLTTQSNIKNIRGLYRGINKLRDTNLGKGSCGSVVG
jgi:hypothetical protein